MSGTLNLIDRLLAIGRNLQKVHQHSRARQYLGRLAALPDLPAEIAEEVQVRLGEIALRRKQYRRARRHLSIALLHQPDSARYHWLMGRALQKGPGRDLERAAAHYEKAIASEPEQPRCLAAYGLLLLRLDRKEEGLAALSRAVDLKPNDPAIVNKLVNGLCRTGRANEAESVLRAARFRNPREARFQRLWNDFMFQRLHKKQQARREAAPDAWTEEKASAILPFIRPAATTLAEGTIRQDQAEPLAGPHLRRPARRSGRKHG